MEDKLLLQLKTRQHFVESSDIYSMRDLIDVQKDTLLPELAKVHYSWAQHIKTDCEVNVKVMIVQILCKGKFCDVEMSAFFHNFVFT